MPRPQPKTRIDLEQQMQLQDLHNEINVIKNNHLHHMQMDLTNLSNELKDTKDTFDKRFDKLDERMWLIVGLVITTLITIVVGTVFGA